MPTAPLDAPADLEPPPPPAWPGLTRIEIAPKTILLILGVIAGVWMLSLLTTVFSVIVVALVLVGTFDPVVAWLQKRGLRRGRALVLVFVVAALVITGVVLMMIPPLVSQLLQLIGDAPHARDRVVKMLDGYGWAKPLVSAIKQVPVDDLTVRAGKLMLSFSLTLFAAIGYGISTLFLAIYLLADPTRSKGIVYALTPRHYHVKLAKILLELKIIVGGYMRGQLITSVAIAVFVFILLTALGADNALPIALFAGITDIIPFVGGYIASTPVVIAVAPQGATVAVVILVVMVLYQEFESRILVPRVYGRVLRLPPAMVLVSLLIGGTLAGILGALLALPIAAGLQMVIRELRVELPGEGRTTVRTIAMDERATVVYEQLSEGASAADAGMIAEDLAASTMKHEHAEPPLRPEKA